MIKSSLYIESELPVLGFELLSLEIQKLCLCLYFKFISVCYPKHPLHQQ